MSAVRTAGARHRNGLPVTVPEVGPLRFTDDLIRPFVVVAVTSITVVQLVIRPPAALPELTWTLTVLTAAACVAALFPWTRLSPSAQGLLLIVFAVLAGLLFALSRDTAAPAFAFVVSSVAGEKLGSRSMAFTVAATGTAVALSATLLAGAFSVVPQQPEWWLALAVWLPVYIGTSRRDRAAALAAAEFAAVQGERAASAESREAALEERGRIARELHDLLGHSLSSIAMQLDLADALHVDDRDEEANAAVLRARALATEGIGETRRAIHALREETLPLADTLARLATGSDASFVCLGDPVTIPVEVAQAIIRTAQEAITNASRHAPGGRVSLRLDYREHTVSISVTDTGPVAGADRLVSPGGGMGLVGMRERASLLGGTLRAGPADPPDTGWIVDLELPR